MESDNQEVDISSFTNFSEEQQYYISLLSKFSGRQKNITVVSSQDLPSRKISYIKDNLGFLKIDEQVMFNNEQMKIRKALTHATVSGGTIATGVMINFIIKAPLTKNLYFEAVKSGIVGILVGFGYYRVQNFWFNENLHKIYLIALERTKGQRQLQ